MPPPPYPPGPRLLDCILPSAGATGVCVWGGLTSSWARRNMASLVNSAMMFLTGMLDTWSIGYNHSPCPHLVSVSASRLFCVCLPPLLLPRSAMVGGLGGSKVTAKAGWGGGLGVGGS